MNQHSERPTPRCPACDEPSALRTAACFPFCSTRCAHVDLGGWLSGEFRVPATEPPDGFEETGLAPVH